MIKPIQNTFLKTIVLYFFYPFISLGTLFIYFYFVNPSSVPLISLLVGEISVTAIITLHLFERLFPYRESWNKPNNDRLINFFFTVIFLPFFTNLIQMGLSSIFSRPNVFSHLSIYFQFFIFVIICEFFYYWAHRFAHRYKVLWRFHSIHHSVNRIYWDNSGFFHPVDLFLSMFFYLSPLYFLGAPPVILGGFLVLNAVTGLMEHANVNLKAGYLNYFFNTAELHRWHHSTIPKISSTNFGKTTSLWDLIFQSRYLPSDKEVGEVGLKTEVIPEDFWGQLIYPFKRK